MPLDLVIWRFVKNTIFVTPMSTKQNCIERILRAFAKISPATNNKIYVCAFTVDNKQMLDRNGGVIVIVYNHKNFEFEVKTVKIGLIKQQFPRCRVCSSNLLKIHCLISYFNV